MLIKKERERERESGNDIKFSQIISFLKSIIECENRFTICVDLYLQKLSGFFFFLSLSLSFFEIILPPRQKIHSKKTNISPEEKRKKINQEKIPPPLVVPPP